ncbi:amidohydrolase [Croceivirga radicis]|uniref:Amidohydrolase n=1 Tax=Croceivirga radicis TaxID=1929488 RepID=A0A1V6LPK8_9FLAO|nr:amidohydrolase [Croceivirga radicis]OQD42135.1 amidohydrolase [Croceivirga radicis]
MKKHFLTIAALTTLLFACKQKQAVDLIVSNATIYTVDSTFSKATYMAIDKGKIVALANSNELLNTYSGKETFDAEGKTIVPGLIDAHCHFYGLGLNQQIVDLVGTNSFDEVIERVKTFAASNQATVIRGRGWDQNDWSLKEFPANTVLNELFPDKPVVLERVDGHAYLVNNAALKLAGINMDTQVSGGDILKKDNELTGVLVDNPMALVDAVMPKPSRATQIKALKQAEKICFDYGLTTVNDAGLDKEIIYLVDSLQQAGDLSIRMYAMVSNTPENLDHFLNKGILKTDRLNVRSVKVYGDGALGSRGAALKQEYSDKPGHFGALVTPADKIEGLAKRIAATDYQMNTHAIGDSANIVVLKAYKSALEGKNNRRWKVEHAQILENQDFDYFSSGIIPSVQPTHATSDMYWAEDRLGKERIHGAYAYQTLLRKAGLVALGTDFPVEQVSPFLTFYAAVARQDLEQYPQEGFMKEEALTREETLKGMTIWAAYSNFEENEKGSLEPGKLADFTVLDKDLLAVPVDSIPFVKATDVFVNGKKVK